MNYFTVSVTFPDNIQKNINDFISNVNTIICHFHMTNTEVKYKLLKSYCMPLYGCCLWDFSGQDVNKFYVTWRKCIRRLLNVPYNTHCKLLYPVVSDIPVEMQLHKRFVNFAREVMLSNNSLIKLCFRLAINGSCSSFCNSYIFIKYTYNMKWNLCDVNDKFNHTSLKLSTDDLVTVNTIKELLCLRDEGNHPFTATEINQMLKYLCT